MRSKRHISIDFLLALSWATVVFPQSPSNVQFLTFEQAEPIVKGMKSDVPSTLASSLPLTSATWSNWLNNEDAAIRGRLARGAASNNTSATLWYLQMDD